MRLSLNELRNIIRKMILLETKFKADPYELEPVQGKIKATDKSKSESYTYSLKAKKMGLWFDLNVLDFPQGNSISLVVGSDGDGKKITKILDKEKVKDTLRNGWGQKEVEMVLKDGTKIKFIKGL